jgi:hypothetical protein
MSQCSKRNASIRSGKDIEMEDALVEYGEFRSIFHRGLDEIELSLGTTVNIPVEEIKASIIRQLDVFSETTKKPPQPPYIKESKALFAYLKFFKA